jgi:hypothetical protein
MRLRFSSLLLGALLAAGNCAFGSSNHYLDCSGGSDASDSLTPQTAWRTVSKANSYTFLPGDRLLLRRGSRCNGMLWPKGSGTERAPIRLGAYGIGALPIVAGGDQSAGLKLENQQFWEIENIEVIGGSPYGIHIGGNEPKLRHFRVTNVIVHDVPGTPTTKDSGLVVISPDKNAKTRFSDVIVDGVTAYQTSEWAGVIVRGSDFDPADESDRGEHIEIRNSIVHDVAGDGILLALVVHGVIEHNVTWHTGMQETQTIGTPNAIWEWMCSDCRVAYNEGYFSDSPGVDGGVFDIDYGDRNNLLEDNFGHDSQGYCLSVFGAEGPSGNTVQSVVRRNTCIHNGRSPRLAKRQGAIFLYTWNGGKLNGFDVEENIVLWDPPIDVPAVQSKADLTGNLPNRIVNNTIMSLPETFVASIPGIQVSGNRFCAPKRPPKQPIEHESPSPGAVPGTDDRRTANNDSDFTANTPAEICDCLRDVIAKASSSDSGRSRTAVPNEPPVFALAKSGLDLSHDGWLLLAFLNPPGDIGSAASRSDLVLIESMSQQFASLGLTTVVVPTRPITDDGLRQWQTDWNFDRKIEIDASRASMLGNADLTSGPPAILLISPSGRVISEWHNPIAPADLWLVLQGQLGTPMGMQQMPACRAGNAQ